MAGRLRVLRKQVKSVITIVYFVERGLLEQQAQASMDPRRPTQPIYMLLSAVQTLNV